MSRIEENRFL